MAFVIVIVSILYTNRVRWPNYAWPSG